MKTEKKTYRSGPYQDFFAEGTQVGNTLYLSGQVGVDHDGNTPIGIAPKTIYMGWQTDPYQPCEAEYRQTRQVLELLLEKGFSASILTKSDLVLRDSDILQEMETEPRPFLSKRNLRRTRPSHCGNGFVLHRRAAWAILGPAPETGCGQV